MSSPFFERPTTEHRIGDHHDRIRALEALVASGSDPSVCPDCVLDPFTVNPGDIEVPAPFRGCVNVAGGSASWGDVCDNSQTSPLIPAPVPIGFCSYLGLGTPLGLQVRIAGGTGGNIQNLIVYVGDPVSQVWSVGWEPGESPTSYDSGWVDVDASVCSGASCSELDLFATFSPHNLFAGSCILGGFVAARFVVLNDDEEFRGALDDLPQAEDGDVIHFDSRTHEFTTGPARRRTALFLS